MKNMKTVLAVVLAICLMMSLAVPAFATETTGATEASVAVTEATTAATDAATETTTAATNAATETTGAVATTAPHDHDHEGESATETTGAAEEKTTAVDVIRIVLIVLEVIASLALILVVLMQTGKEEGLGAISGNSDSYMNRNGAGNLDQKLAAATKWVALAWILLTLALSLVH